MMAEETDKSAGIKTLIAQRKQRPSYTRYISWEFSQPCNVVSHKPKKGSKKTTERNDGTFVHMSVGNNCDEDSGDSEYFSAEETLNFDDIWNPLCSVSSSGSSNYENEIENEDVFQSSYSTCCSADHTDKDNILFSENKTTRNSERKRAPSKKQKRRRRKDKRDIYLSDLPFQNSSFGDLDFQDTSTVCVQKQVPSLFDICLQVARRISVKSKYKSGTVPVGIKKKVPGSSISFQKTQLSWFYQILSLMEKDLPNKIYGGEKFEIAMRNIWSLISHPYPNNTDTRLCRGNRKISCLPFTTMYSRGHSYIYCDFSIQVDIMQTYIMSILSTTLDLMLPYTVRIPLRCNPKQTAIDPVSVAYKQAVSRVKDAMNKRYPFLMKFMFDRVLPYVYWARGDIANATEAFRHLIYNEKKPRLKALYMSEIGRMAGMFGDSKLKLDYLNESTEAFGTKGFYTRGDSVSCEIQHQSLLLKANLYDQGVMTSSSGAQASSLWQASISTPRREETFESLDQFFFIDSLLCFHSGTFCDPSKDWLEDAKQKLEVLCENYPELFLYLSMVYAMQGNDKMSHRAYKIFTQRQTVWNGNLPGFGVKPLNSVETNPWTDLLMSVNTRLPALKPLQVVWRTQLCAPRMIHTTTDEDYQDPYEADWCSRDLNLRLTPEGNITGDMQLLFPPLRAVHLNPHTGFLVLPKSQKTEVWMSYGNLHTMSYENEPCSSFMPTLTEVYSSSGCKVELFNPSARVISSSHQIVPTMHLYWIGSNGQVAKLKIASKLRNFVYEEAKKEIESMNHDQPCMKENMLETIKFLYNKGYPLEKMNKNNAAYLDVNRHIKKDKRPDKVNSKFDPKKVAGKMTAHKFSLELVDVPKVFGKNIFFSMKIDGRNLYMIVNTSDKLQFMQPNILHLRSHIRTGFSKTADNFYLQLEESLFVYDNACEEVDMVDLALLKKIDDNKHVPVIIKNTLFAIYATDKSLYCCCNQDERFVDYLGPIKRFGVVGEMLVLVTKSGSVRFVESHSLLPILAEVNKQLTCDVVDEDLNLQYKCVSFNVLGEKSFTHSNNKHYIRAALALDNRLLILQASPNTFGRDVEDIDSLKVTSGIVLSGRPVDVCFISEHCGYLVSTTIFVKTTKLYRENLYHYSHTGQLLSVLPCLGPGPRSMLPVYLDEDEELLLKNDDTGKGGWHVYMRDGHDGIICLRV